MLVTSQYCSTSTIIQDTGKIFVLRNTLFCVLTVMYLMCNNACRVQSNSKYQNTDTLHLQALRTSTDFCKQLKGQCHETFDTFCLLIRFNL